MPFLFLKSRDKRNIQRYSGLKSIFSFKITSFAAYVYRQKIQVFGDVMSCRIVNSYRRFEE